MTLFGWILISLISVCIIFFGVQLISDVLWNHKLRNFQKTQSITPFKVPRIYWLRRSYGFVMSTLFLIATIASGTFSVPNMMGNRVLLNAVPVGSKETILQLMEESNTGSWWGDLFTAEMPGVLEDSLDSNSSEERDYIGTNNQVEGVEEADIVKTDEQGIIYYATRYYNHIRIIDTNLDGTFEPLADIDLGNLYTDSLYLTDTQLIVIGYVYQVIPYFYQEGVDYYGWEYNAFTGAVYVYDRETLELEYKLETDSNFYQHRLIDDALYLISSKSLYTEDLRPEYIETVDGDSTTSHLSYDSIYYFTDVPVYSMTVVTGIKLDTYDMTSQAFLGNVSEIYASQDAIYTVNNYSTYQFDMYESKVQIIKYALNSTNATVSYVGQKSIPGYVADQYWMDEYDDTFRVVTSSWNPIHNELYILAEDYDTDELKIIGSIKEGLGMPNETVKSVRFDKEDAYVVTFEQHDPLYTIDLSNPRDPKIVSHIEEPGYSTYLHVWDDENHLIGFGLDADENGFETGIKISAYDGDSVLDTFKLNYQDELGIYSYSYSEALYNPKALMISPDKGIIAFPVMSWRYYLSPLDDWNYSYVSEYLIFYIDFNANDPKDIISDPITISHDPSHYYVGIDRGVYLDGIIYTLSYTQLVSYDLETMSIVDSLIFETYFENHIDKVYAD
ncbi:MAG: beta-propeller domain-containing protein [Acholeplasmataceae bacterium]|nr:beta-propeller domain-containing protein [Acholeplasmataceae bacterium]